MCSSDLEKMARSQWLSQRALDIQTSTAAFSNIFKEVDELNKWVRYQMQHERAFEKALNQLLKLRAEKRKEQIGFESEKRAEAVKTEREERRQTRAQHDQLKTETLKYKMDREKSNAIVAGMKAGSAMERHLGPEGAQMMSQMMEPKAA